MSDADPTYTSNWIDLKSTAFRQDFIEAGGIRTRYLASGSSDKPLLLFLHGTGGHAEAYTRNLAAHGEHFHTVAIDMVGHGWSGKPLIDYEYPRLFRARGGDQGVRPRQRADRRFLGGLGRDLAGHQPARAGSADGAQHRRRLDGAPGGDGEDQGALDAVGGAAELRQHARQARVPDVRQVDGQRGPGAGPPRHLPPARLRRDHPPRAVPAGNGNPPAQHVQPRAVRVHRHPHHGAVDLPRPHRDRAGGTRDREHDSRRALRADAGLRQCRNSRTRRSSTASTSTTCWGAEHGDRLRPRRQGGRALVCGSSAGIGRGCAEALAREGVDVVVNGRDTDGWRQTAEEIATRPRRGARRRADIRAGGRGPLLDACPSPTSWSTTMPVRRPAVSTTGAEPSGWPPSKPTCSRRSS